MLDIRAGSNVSSYYPRAVESSYYINAFLAYANREYGISPEQVAFLTSICSDDLNSVGLPRTDMVGPFVQGGLNGFPFAGMTGLGAFSHHIPEPGAALMFFGPHVGITSDGQVGKVVRPGQSTPSDCCGAAAAALKALEAGTITHKEPCDYPVDDYQQETIRQIVLRHKDAILGAGDVGDPRRFVVMTEAIYQETKDAFLRLLANTHFGSPAFFFGGILINRDGRQESLIELRDLDRVQHGKVQDLTSDFAQKAEERFRAFEAGDKNAFR
ncbi:hypothetical protein [Tautonia plasticadhaerens]|uniref:Limiting CO2-inducible protein B/C beta carbonyic anhydrase domain-containing protein n=1 Tax=Tautonia plasticadhaerens TaxID=2527974 RepID=A0A518H2B7_9BACT|nr:hypothetical protein [Tautonia plasticadhaerens]QDV34973.1 hypothetical protein ElP_28700 [Tautonia plasticadhaerens]